MPCYLFVTGKLAAESLETMLDRISADFDYEIAVLPISVAALMDTGFIEKHLTDAAGCDRVYLPGLCKGDFAAMAQRLGVEVIRGPDSLKDIPSYFGAASDLVGYGEYKTKIIAEIVDAYQLSVEAILICAEYYKSAGADIIDLGCPVEGGFANIGNVIEALKARDFKVSVDSFNPDDILKADQAGVDYILSLNSRNINLAKQLRCKVIVIPDFEKGLDSLDRNIAQLESWNIPYIIDPVLRPISFGFAASIEDFIRVRRKYPQADILMGAGNLTELTAADSTGITAVLAGIVAELGISYVLTTEKVSWARGAVREFDLARRLMHFACRNKVLPKHLDNSLITIKDPPFETYGEEELRVMQAKIRDHNFRIFADGSSIYVFNNRLFIKDNDIRKIFERLYVEDAPQAFYLGRELQKAALAVRLGKKYAQEEDLRWGYLSQ
ncbi:MAG: PTS mannitol transporter subunit IIABC [Acidobacteria bacterium]|nr:PTS mannitol transporter subunit IIABC [Acidobacteriota bacterium]